MGGSCSCLSNRPKFGIPTSSSPSSHYRHTISRPLEGQTSTQTIEEQIEHSKIHWSQVSKFELDVDEVAEVSNVEVFRTLQSHPDWDEFFQTFGKDGMGELVMGEKFVEGGQAELYDVDIQWNEPWRIENDLQRGQMWVLKVFKKETSLRQLQLQWPYGMLQNYVDQVESGSRGSPPKFQDASDVYCGILLEDGCFAFLMVKETENLRCYLDCLMLTTRENCCPVSDIESVEYLMYVLCSKFETGWTMYVADYECSIGVVGTWFFRAPEILEACKEYSISDKPELFTKESDVYSYGMVYYEILMGKLPFKDYRQNDFVCVLLGERLKVPEYVVG